MPTSKKIFPSTFRRLVTFKQAMPVVDDGGGVSTSSYETLYQTHASVADMSTSQKLYYGLDAFKDAKQVTLRYTTGRDITTALIMTYNNGGVDTDYNIISQQMITQDQKRYQQLTVQAFDVNASE